MTDPEVPPPTESPATWENVVVGKVTELVGRALHNDETVAEGEEQVEAAHEVREEFDEDRGQH